MECLRLKKLVKNWYIQVQDESMAPARMVDFMRNHLTDCLICMADPLIELEVKRITEIVLPPTKAPKAIRKENDPELSDEEDVTTAADKIDPEDSEDDEEEASEDDEEEDDLEADDEDDEI